MALAQPADTTAPRLSGSDIVPRIIPAHYSTDASAPFAPTQLRLPTAVDLRTFGHCYYLSVKTVQPGGRFQHYRNFGTGYALPSALEVDPATSVTFYTQAPPPADNQDAVPYEDYQYTNPPLAGFRPAPDPKLSRTANTVWIVMVYDAAAP